jgi:hypothetical protein
MGRAGEPNAKRFTPARPMLTLRQSERVGYWPIRPCRLKAFVGSFLLVVAKEEPFDDQNQPDEERNGEQQMAHANNGRSGSPSAP